MKNNKLKIFYIFLLMVLFIIPSCQYETIKLNKCTDVSYANDIQSVFDSKCISCHSANMAIAGLDLSAGNSYNNLINGNFVDLDNPEESKIYIKIKEGHNGASSDDACKILGWIEEGALEN